MTAAAVKTGFNTVHKFAHEHPYWTGAIAVVLIGAGVCLVAPHAVLGALGWKTIGPAAGKTLTPSVEGLKSTHDHRLTDTRFDRLVRSIVPVHILGRFHGRVVFGTAVLHDVGRGGGD